MNEDKKYEMLHYNMESHLFNNDTSSKYYHMILEVMMKIPEADRDFILDNDIYFSYCNNCSGYTNEITINTHNEQTEFRIIAYDFVGMEAGEKLTPSQIKDVVAHEIAHAVLGHSLIYEKDNKTSYEREKEAEEKIVEWGFNRTYTDKELEKFKKYDG